MADENLELMGALNELRETVNKSADTLNGLDADKVTKISKLTLDTLSTY